jgi:hypothetical protein
MNVIVIQMTTAAEVKMSCMLERGLLIMEVITAEEHGILLKFSDFENFFLARHDCLVNHLHAAAIQGTPFK